MAKTYPDDATWQLVNACRLYLRAPSDAYLLNGVPTVDFNPVLSAPEQVQYDAIVAMLAYAKPLTLAQWQTGTWTPPPNSPIGKLAPFLNSDGTINSTAIQTAVGTIAPSAHVHTEANVTSLVTDLAAKAPTAHTHTEANVTSLVTDLAAKAASVHSHPPVFATLANGATAMAFGTNTAVKVTPTALATYTTTVPAAGTEVFLIVLTSGASSFTITFGTGFKPTGTLVTGTTAARVFAISFISDGTNLYETGRTVAMVA